MKTTNKVAVRMMATMEKDMVTLVLKSEDGSPLSNQDIVDAVAEYLLLFAEEVGKHAIVKREGLSEKH